MKNNYSEIDSAETSGNGPILDDIADLIVNRIGIECNFVEDGLRVMNDNKGTLVSVQPPGRETAADPGVEEVIRVETYLTPRRKFYPGEILKLNSLSALGAVLHKKGSRELKIVSKQSVHSNNQEERELSVHMMASAAVVNVFSFFGGGASAGLARNGSAWSKEDFSGAAGLLSTLGFAAIDSSTGMSLEIPLDPDIMAEVPMSRTSLLQFDTREKHPNLGTGLFYKLELPMNFTEVQLIDLSHILNELEFTEDGGPPMIGGWTGLPARGSLAYVGFWTNNMYWPGIVANLSVWMCKRNEWASKMIDTLFRVGSGG